MFTKTLGFIKVPKRLLYDKKFISLSNSAKIFLIYLISFSNSARNSSFYIKKEQLKEYLSLSRSSVWRLKKELEKFNIKMTSKNGTCYFNLVFFYDNWTEIKSF